jgi:hypothetical protein
MNNNGHTKHEQHNKAAEVKFWNERDRVSILETNQKNWNKKCFSVMLNVLGFGELSWLVVCWVDMGVEVDWLRVANLQIVHTRI